MRSDLKFQKLKAMPFLFYKFGDPPGLQKLYRQVEKMFCEFHKSLIAYDRHKYCECKACLAAINLTLKVISHYGEFTGYNVKNFSKLIGKDIIVAHQLLKNDIEDHEYWLATQSLLRDTQPEGLASWMMWNQSTKQTESGEVTFQYTQLGQLKNELVPEPPLHRELASKVRMFSLSREYETDIITLLHATSNPSYRNRWQEDVKRVEEVNHFLPRVGMKWRSIMENGEVVIYSSSYNFTPDKVEFSETDEKKRTATYFTLQKTGRPKQTRLTLDFYTTKNLSTQIVFRLLKERKLKETFNKSLQNLAGLVKELRIPSAINE